MTFMMNQKLHGLNQSHQFNDTLDEYCFINPLDCLLDGEAYEEFKLTNGRIASALFMTLLAIIALGGNILLCTAFLFYRRLRKTTNYFIISLAVSDVIVAAICMPIWISYEVTDWVKLPHWIQFRKLYFFWKWFDMLSGVSSIANLTAISIDRFFSIMAPLLHRTRMTPFVAVVMIALAWIYGIILASFGHLEWKYFTMMISLAGFFLPLTVIVIAYLGIYWKVKRGFLRTRPDNDWNLERTLLIVISVFVICWVPFFVFALLYEYCHECVFDNKAIPYALSFIKWMHYLNSCLNPFIYGFFNTNFKIAFRALLQQCFRGVASEHDANEPQAEKQSGRIISRIRNLGRRIRNSQRDNRNRLIPESEFPQASSTTMTSVTMSTGSNSNVLNNNACGSQPSDGNCHGNDKELPQGKVTESRSIRFNGVGYRQLSDSSKSEDTCNGRDMVESCNDKYTECDKVGELDKTKEGDLSEIEFRNAQESCV